MNRLFGKGKEKTPGPNMTDCISGVCIVMHIINELYLSYILKRYIQLYD